jgi:hypothetical protein
MSLARSVSQGISEGRTYHGPRASLPMILPGALP